MNWSGPGGISAIEQCVRCGGRLKVIASIEEPELIGRILGRIRRDLSDSTGRWISIFSAGDQLLKRAALNAVQIAEELLA